MFSSKYSKVLTVILIIAIIVILGLLVYVGIDWYKAYTASAEAGDIAGQFNDFVKNTAIDNTQTNTEGNDVNVIEPDINTNNTVDNTQNNNGNGSNDSGLTYKGFKVLGKIEIPKTKVNLPVLEKVTPKSLEASVGVLYGPGINQVGNTVIIGHNFRKGTFFSNNKKLSVGDKIYLTDMQGTKITYTITKKYTTTTDDFDYAGRDTKGKREISLSTCTDDTKNRLVIWAKED